MSIPQVYHLIKSLTPAEKGHFKKFGLSKAKDSKYASLFDILNQMDEYDEPELTVRLRKKKVKFSNKTYLQYLYKIVRDSLLNYHRDKTDIDKILNLYREIEIIKKKGLPFLADRSEQALALILDNGIRSFYSFGYLQSYHRVGTSKENVVRRSELAQEGLKEAQKWTEIYQMYILDCRMWELVNEYGFHPVSEDGMAAFRNFIDVELQNLPELTDTNSRIILSKLHLIFYGYFGEIETAIQPGLELIRSYKKKGNLSLYRRHNYVLVVSNLLTIILTHQKVRDQKTMEIVNELESELIAFYPEILEDINDSVSIAHMDYSLLLIDTQLLRSEGLDAKIKGAMDSRKSIRASTFRYESIPVISAGAHFISKKYQECLDMILFLREEKRINKEEVECTLSFLEIMCHYQLGNSLLIPSLIRRLSRFISKREIKFEFDRIVLAILNNIYQENMEKKDVRKKILKHLKKLTDLRSNPRERHFFLYVPIDRILIKEFLPG